MDLTVYVIALAAYVLPLGWNKVWGCPWAEANFASDCMSKILFAIFVPGPTTPSIEVITKLDVAHHSTSSRGWPSCLRLHN